MKDQTRNLNPHKAAIVAMLLYSSSYAAQGGGSMDFWDGLPKQKKILCRDLVDRIEKAPEEPK
jgi:hypothetical protein